ncbi:Uncharacterised protein [Chlamydia trachomatis]|nr:Uncharacterised protein [Chlamydia trachomatis]
MTSNLPLREYNKCVICRAILRTEFTAKCINALVIPYQRKNIRIINKWLSTKIRIRNSCTINDLFIVITHTVKRRVWTIICFFSNIELPTNKLVTSFNRNLRFAIFIRWELNSIIFYTNTLKNIILVILEIPVTIRSIVSVILFWLLIREALVCHRLILRINNFQYI